MYMSLFGASVLMLLGFIYWMTAGFMERQTEETINAEIQGLAEQYTQLGIAGLAEVIRNRMANDPEGGSLYLLTDWRLQPIVGNVDDWPEIKPGENGWLTITLERGLRRYKQARVRHFLLAGNFHLLVGRDVSEKNLIQRLIIDSLAWGLAITLVLGLAGGVVMSRGLLRRIDIINRASRQIMQGDLSRRMPTFGSVETGDEFDQLAHNLNDMLDQIERLMAGIKQVSDNIAHDLRSPLNRLRNRLEVSLMGDISLPEARGVIEESIIEADGILNTFNALLRIAQAEAGAGREDVCDLDLSAMAADIAEFYEPLAEEKEIVLATELPDEAVVRGNRHLLAQALTNLVDNAIKYTPEQGRISISVEQAKNAVTLTVADSGPGIPADERDKVIRRFYRVEASRNSPGVGLGLSLVAAVAKLHYAELLLGDNEPGLKASVVFPVK